MRQRSLSHSRVDEFHTARRLEGRRAYRLYLIWWMGNLDERIHIHKRRTIAAAQAL